MKDPNQSIHAMGRKYNLAPHSISRIIRRNFKEVNLGIQQDTEEKKAAEQTDIARKAEKELKKEAQEIKLRKFAFKKGEQ